MKDAIFLPQTMWHTGSLHPLIQHACVPTSTSDIATSPNEAYGVPTSADGEYDISTSTNTAYEIPTSAYVAADVPTSTNEAYKTTQGQTDSDTLTYYYTCYDATVTDI